MAFTFDSNVQMERKTIHSWQIGLPVFCFFATQLDLLDKGRQYLVPPIRARIFMLSHTNKTNQVSQLAVLSQHLQMCNYVN